MYYSLIAGLHSFMEEDTEDSSVDLNPEEIDAIEQAAERGSEIAATATEIEAVDDQTEMFMECFDDIINRYNYVKKYGVDRTFLRLFNSNNELSRQFHYYLPSCESFATVGDPNSKESIACMEGFVDVVKDIWNFIKGIIKKIFGFIGKIFESIRVRVGELNGQIGRLRKLNSERTSDVAKIENVDKQIWSLNNLTSNGSSSNDDKKEENKSGNESFATMAAAVAAPANGKSNNTNGSTAGSNKSNKGGLEGALEEMQSTFDANKAVKQVEDVIAKIRAYCTTALTSSNGGKEPPSGVNDVHVKAADTEVENLSEQMKDFRKSWKDTKSDIKKILGRVDKTEIKYVPGTAIDGYLNFAAKLMAEIDNKKSIISISKNICNTTSMIANHMDARGDNSREGLSLAEHKKIANCLSTAMNLSTELTSFTINMLQKLAGMAVYAASARLSYRTKTTGDDD